MENPYAAAVKLTRVLAVGLLSLTAVTQPMQNYSYLIGGTMGAKQRSVFRTPPRDSSPHMAYMCSCTCHAGVAAVSHARPHQSSRVVGASQVLTAAVAFSIGSGRRRSVLNALLFRKSLRLSNEARQVRVAACSCSPPCGEPLYSSCRLTRQAVQPTAAVLL